MYFPKFTDILVLAKKYLNLKFDLFMTVQAVPVLITILMRLGFFKATTLGATSLIIGDQNHQKLSALLDRDLVTLKNSVSKLEVSLGSQAEIVLQKHRVLDLLLTKNVVYA